jgi:hypothetical protein
MLDDNYDEPGIPLRLLPWLERMQPQRSVTDTYWEQRPDAWPSFRDALHQTLVGSSQTALHLGEPVSERRGRTRRQPAPAPGTAARPRPRTVRPGGPLGGVPRRSCGARPRADADSNDRSRRRRRRQWRGSRGRAVSTTYYLVSWTDHQRSHRGRMGAPTGASPRLRRGSAHNFTHPVTTAAEAPLTGGRSGHSRPDTTSLADEYARRMAADRPASLRPSSVNPVEEVGAHSLRQLVGGRRPGVDH